MDYTKAYNTLCENAKKRSSVEGYVEKHHIVPRSLGGGDTQENIVTLTYREHKLAHRLLTKMYPDSIALATCYYMMAGNMSDASRKLLQKNMRVNNPSFKSVWNKGRKGLMLRKTKVTEKEKKNLSERMKRNNPNADGKRKRRKTLVKSVDGKTSYIFDSQKEAMECMREVTGQTINASRVSAYTDSNKSYKGYYWSFL